MKILYIFPHPDDEAFGPAGAIHQQKKQGHEVHLLTLTKGEATKIRYQLGISEAEMAQKREKELENVATLLRLDSLNLLNFPDSGLAHIDIRILEKAIEDHILLINPDILVTFPVHGISGHHDHLTTHFIVKNLFLKLKGENLNLKRLAFITLPREESGNDESKGGNFKVNRSLNKYIDAIIEFEDDDRNAFFEALNCYPMFKEIIEESKVKTLIGRKLHFEIYLEKFDPPLKSLTDFSL